VSDSERLIQHILETDKLDTKYIGGHGRMGAERLMGGGGCLCAFIASGLTD
jgi:hypothetical protein